MSGKSKQSFTQVPEPPEKAVIISAKTDQSLFGILTKAGINVIYNPLISNNSLISLSCEESVSAIIINSRRKISKLFLARCGVKLIATASKGTDNIDTSYAAKSGIKIINSHNGNSDAAAEHTIALVLSIYKKICLSDCLVRAGRFTEYDSDRHNLRGKSIGIIGTGEVGSRVVRLALAFGMKIYCNDINPYVRRVQKRIHPGIHFRSTEFIFNNCDVVTLHIPLENNKGFVDSVKLSLLKKDSVIINTSRGDVIDEEFLIKILEKNKIYFAGLDVFRDEPVINKRFFKLKNTVLTNHTAGKTTEAEEYILKDIFMQVKNYIIKST